MSQTVAENHQISTQSLVSALAPTQVSDAAVWTVRTTVCILPDVICRKQYLRTNVCILHDVVNSTT